MIDSGKPSNAVAFGIYKSPYTPEVSVTNFASFNEIFSKLV